MVDLSSDDANGVGTTSDMALRLRMTLPAGWFPVSPPLSATSVTPILDGLLAGLAAAWSFCFSLLSLTSAQTRLGTAFGSFLDMISTDFFGKYLPRKQGESDESFRGRIRKSLVIQRGTRQDVCRAVMEMTSSTPVICEPTRGLDCGGYASLANSGAGGGFGYCAPGLHYGSSALCFQYFLNISDRAPFAMDKISIRQSPATFLNQAGLIKLAPSRVLRPDFQEGVCIGAIVEARAFNLIINSRFWNNFAQSPVASSENASWFIDYVTPGIFEFDPVLSISGNSGVRLSGPSVDIACAGSTVCGSVWICLVAGLTATKVELVLTDLSHLESSIYTSADMTLLGRWQRLSLSLTTQGVAGKNLRIGLLLSGSSSVDEAVLTQCWQVELGETPSSYIPTDGTLGIREQDDFLSVDPTLVPATFNIPDILDAVASTIPVATIAWTAVSLTPSVG